MSERTMVESVETALRDLGDSEAVTAAGQFQPRGHTGSMFAGGMIGDSLAGGAGGLADSVATTGGALAGARMHDAASGLPTNMLVDKLHRVLHPARGNRIPLTHSKDVIDVLRA